MNKIDIYFDILKITSRNKRITFQLYYCRSQANFLFALYKSARLDIFEENEASNFRKSISEVRQNTDNAISGAHKLYGETEEEQFSNILVGLE